MAAKKGHEKALSNIKKHKLKTRYEKTFTGKTTDTIIYLGYKIKGNKLGVSKKSIDKMRQKWVRVKEQGASAKRLRTASENGGKGVLGCVGLRKKEIPS